MSKSAALTAASRGRGVEELRRGRGRHHRRQFAVAGGYGERLRHQPLHDAVRRRDVGSDREGPPRRRHLEAVRRRSV